MCDLSPWPVVLFGNLLGGFCDFHLLYNLQLSRNSVWFSGFVFSPFNFRLSFLGAGEEGTGGSGSGPWPVLCAGHWRLSM